MRRAARWILGVTLLALASDAGAQGSDRSVSLALGPDYTTRHWGLTVEGRFSRGAGRLGHHVGAGASLAPITGLDACMIAPDGGCFDDEPFLFTAFYETHLRLAGAHAGSRPYVGGRVSGVRGWNGRGFGVGAVAGVESGGYGRGLARAEVVADHLFTTASGASGTGWRAVRLGVRLGFGLRL